MSSIAFIGAGASASFGIPTMAGLVEEFEKELSTGFPGKDVELYKDIKWRLRSYMPRDIEALITVLNDIVRGEPAVPLSHPSVHFFSWWDRSFDVMVQYQTEWCVRSHDTAENLLSRVKEFIVGRCKTNEEEFEVYEAFINGVLREEGNGAQALSASSFKGADYELFTTNYDVVLETFFNGRKPRRRRLDFLCGEALPDTVNLLNFDNFLYHQGVNSIKIFKLHGSINWYLDERGEMKWATSAMPVGQQTARGDRSVKELMIYPAQQKYSFREPFYDMFYYLKRRLVEPMNRQCYVVGYSFRDDDILGLFHDALDQNQGLQVVLLDPEAETIRSERFRGFSAERVRAVYKKFSVEAVKELFPEPPEPPRLSHTCLKET